MYLAIADPLPDDLNPSMIEAHGTTWFLKVSPYVTIYKDQEQTTVQDTANPQVAVTVWR